MQRLLPVVGADDIGAVFVIFERAGGDRIATVPALLLTDFKPFLQALLDRADFARESGPFF